MDPDTLETLNEAFIDALDSEPTTKPYLVIEEGGVALPGDFDGDGDVDLDDYAVFYDCTAGPAQQPSPTLGGVTSAMCLGSFDFDTDSDGGLADFAPFSDHFTG